MKEGYYSPEISPAPVKKGKKEAKTAPPASPETEQTRPDLSPVKGEIFNAHEELTDILKLPKAERQAKIKEFKEKLAYQKEGLAKIQEEIMAVITAFPDTSYDQLFERAKEMGAKYGLDWYSEELIRWMIRLYEEKHETVQEIRKKYPNDKELFKAAFGRKPKGRIEVTEGPMALHLRIQHPEDYAFIYSQAFLNRSEPTPEEITQSQKTGGCFITTSLLPGLAITVENAAGRMIDDFSRQIRAHEEQHAITELFKKENERLTGGYPINEAYDAIFADGIKNLEENLRRYLLYSRRADVEEHIKNEILSFSKQGVSAQETVKDLTEKNDLYDYLSKLDRDLSTHLIAALGKNHEPLIKKITGEVFNREKHEQLIKDAVAVFSALRKKGYTLEQTIALLQPEPLFQWKKTYKRLTGESIQNKE